MTLRVCRLWGSGSDVNPSRVDVGAESLGDVSRTLVGSERTSPERRRVGTHFFPIRGLLLFGARSDFANGACGERSPFVSNVRPKRGVVS